MVNITTSTMNLMFNFSDRGEACLTYTKCQELCINAVTVNIHNKIIIGVALMFILSMAHYFLIKNIETTDKLREWVAFVLMLASLTFLIVVLYL